MSKLWIGVRISVASILIHIMNLLVRASRRLDSYWNGQTLQLCSVRFLRIAAIDAERYKVRRVPTAAINRALREQPSCAHHPRDGPSLFLT